MEGGGADSIMIKLYFLGVPEVWKPAHNDNYFIDREKKSTEFKRSLRAISIKSVKTYRKYRSFQKIHEQ